MTPLSLSNCACIEKVKFLQGCREGRDPMVNLHPPPAANRGDEIFPDQGFLWGGVFMRCVGVNPGETPTRRRVSRGHFSLRTHLKPSWTTLRGGALRCEATGTCAESLEKRARMSAGGEFRICCKVGSFVGEARRQL